MTFQRSLAKIALLFVMAVSAHAQTPPSFETGYRAALLQINLAGLTRHGFMNNLATIWLGCPRRPANLTMMGMQEIRRQ